MKYLLILAIIFTSLYSCNPEFGCARDWKFEIPFTIENEQTIYNVGDTIWVISKFDKMLNDINSEDKIELPNFENYNFILLLMRLDTVPTHWAYNDISIYPRNGEFSYQSYTAPEIEGEGRIYDLLFEDLDESWGNKIGFKLNNKGTFMIEISHRINWNFDTPLPLTDNCKDYLDGFQIKFINGTTDNNFELYIKSPKPSYFTDVKEVYLELGSFTFKVIE